ncbi:hypothetical protein NDU88_010732 [Pleurodeles waltl]|uniref:LRRCT domain-containing protein n=1 Tax=Pleurodeles waltl TaxID=8319 RepID=A0AAV7PWW4_PLEWA|nr:hypothetical protein NDU88_010732 [Pleurodeles waltl]
MAPTWIQVVFSALLLPTMVLGLQCPSECKCSQEEEGVSADCGGSAGEASEVADVPEGFPADVFSINLVHHKVRTLNKSSFEGLDDLSFLYLFANQIDSIDPEAFADLTHLTVLDLSYNHLRTLTVEHLKPLEDSLQKLYLDNNPWHCTCDLLPLQSWLKKMEDKVAESMYITCATPPAVHRRPLLGLTPNDMGCSAAPTAAPTNT